MKYLKTYEKLNDYKPHKGDFVIHSPNLIYGNFLENNIGQITSIRSHDDICVKYNNIPDNIKPFFRTYNRNGAIIYYIHTKIDSIVVFSKNIDEIELKLKLIKYNL